MIKEVERYFISVEEYQGIYDDMHAADTDEAWHAFREAILEKWFLSYEESLREAGYVERGGLYSYDTNTFTYSYNVTYSNYDEWWSQHRDNPRMVAVHGHSTTVLAPRNDRVLRLFRHSGLRECGPTPKAYAFDQGHYIGHKLGGQVDNGLFRQRRDVNRGWGENKGFFAMERYAQANPGTFVFCRPVYGDGSDCPFYVEYGILRPDKTWWVQVFPNRYSFTPFSGFENFPEWRQEQIRELRRKAQAKEARREAARKRLQ